ncbi:MAG TPA: hypothetical protein VLI93_08005 [Acetobacteraceae bacterium]|nr:hypothetical protein [Acetobacteraceae bacterium]
MTDQAHHLAQRFRCMTDRPIVGPLPLEDAKRITGRYVDSDTILRTALFGVNDGWFNTYWCDRQADSKARLVGRVVRRLGSAIRVSARRLQSTRLSTLTHPFGRSIRAVPQTVNPTFARMATNTKEAPQPLTDTA